MAVTGHPFHVVRDGDGNFLMKWVRSAANTACAECDGAIHAGNAMAVYDDVASNSGQGGKNLHIERTYCQPCGELLEDSLLTTEAM